jgi:hypothetical protein
MLGVELLAKIGSDLDDGIYPLVHDRGIVEPVQPRDHLQKPGTEVSSDERQISGRPAAGSRKRTAGGAWPSGGPASERPRSPDTASSFFNQLAVTDGTATELKGVAGAYPQVQFPVHSGVEVATQSRKTHTCLEEVFLRLPAVGDKLVPQFFHRAN